jgi:4-amino-4-deoxy-L-arabinose transferase-like glycosyltransferase
MEAASPPAALAPDESDRGRRLAGLAVAALCGLTLLAKLLVNAPRTGLNHGDVSFYFTVAKNIAEGRGFVIDYIWNFWNDPQGFPTPANVWWMPLPSIVCAIGMRFFGTSYAVAQTSMIVATSVLPFAIYLLGRELFGGRAVPLAGAALATTFHLFMDQPCAPLSHGPYVVLSTFALWLILRAARTGRGWIWAGLLIGATQMARSDGLLLFGALGVAWLLARPRPGWRALAAAVAGYVLAMAPWWTHNLVELGAIQPPGSFRAVFLRGYEQWYSLPKSVNWDTWRQDGWGPIWDLKLDVGSQNAQSFAAGMVTGGFDREGVWGLSALQAMLWLAWVGVLLALLRKETRCRLAPVGVQALAIYLFYTLLFTAVGKESFRTGMFSIYPTLLLCAASALLCGCGFLARVAPLALRPRVAGVLATLLAAWLMWGHYAWSRDSMVRKAESIARLDDFYATIKDKALPKLGADPVLMARDVHELHALTGVRCVQIPFEPEPAIRAIAHRYGVTHIVLIGDPANPVRPALKDIDKMPWCELVVQAKPQGQMLRIYRIKD